MRTNLKVVILAGGLGTRLQEETVLKPKPMVEIGGWPILWHIMKTYSAYGFKEFVIALGYKGEAIKDYFLSYRYRRSSLTVCTHDGTVEIHDGPREDWTVHLVDTGADTETGGRVKLLADILGNETFLLTYGDGVANVDIGKLLAFHESHGKLATVTAVRPPARFGGLLFEGDRVVEFMEKPQIGEGWINGGFFCLEPEVLGYIAGTDTIFERAPLETLAKNGQLIAHRHEGFWHPMDTVRDVRLLDNLWRNGTPPWKVWA
jgi:glucose-1-phosphate cytidylyltransferase